MPTCDGFQPAKRLVLRTLMLVMCAIMAMIVPKFGLFINLVGAFACTVLAFIMPVWIYNKLYADELTTQKRIAHHLLVFFGIVVGGIATAVSVYELMEAFAHQDDADQKIEIIDASKTDVLEIDLSRPPQGQSVGPGISPGQPHLLF